MSVNASQEQKYISSITHSRNMYGFSSPASPSASDQSHYSSAAECSPDSLSVSEEELRNELSLLGYPSVPRDRLLQFKEDLEYLMRSRRPLELSSGASGDGAESGKENNPTSPEVSAAWKKISAWPTSSSSSSQVCVAQAPGQRDHLDSYSTHTVSVGGHSLGKQRPPALTRKVLRRKSDGQVQVCDESFLSSQTETEDKDTTVSSVESNPQSVRSQSTDCIKSFIRLPPYSLLDQYRQRSDPVGRYQEYKQSWDALQGALERSKKELRWEIRERMMSAPPLPLPRPLPTPNAYVIPTEKKRYGLRWAIRQDLVNGNIPRGSYS
ncbi:LOW QUALITY PROTEIN: centriolar and ciliogenesis-associated protein HYLS1 [Mixophyes fleayi]|uniref:LOW QUALITY PROTEIN: centriolar and ciliogenesis-associated protein HYLS1 n=1 Tax=Mixophyes fleayi TaxID=3061075 RepID=UPI003F4E177C